MSSHRPAKSDAVRLVEPPAPGKGKRAAFTLVELLVVIGIIAVLIAVLLPVLGRARQAASAVKCQANLREIGTAMRIYAVANKDSLPPGFYIMPPIPPGSETVVRWVDLLMGTLSSKYGYNSTDAFLSSSDAARLRKIFVCPDAPSEDIEAGTVFACTYLAHPRLMPQMNSSTTMLWIPFDPYYLNRTPPRNVPKTTCKFGRIKRSSEIAIIWDAPVFVSPTTGRWVLSDDGTPVANQLDLARYYTAGSPNFTDDYRVGGLKPSDPVEIKQGFQGKFTNKDAGANYQTIRFRHLRDTQGNALMADGHVQPFRYNDSTKSSTLTRGNIYVNLQQ